MSAILEVRGLSKNYSIQKEASFPPTLAGRFWSALRRNRGAHYRVIEALKELSFSVNEGEFVGILGNNGAGKSTLLKVLSRVTEPDAGEFIIRGQTASLLEIGTGFHPELSGRENIYLMGTLLGMRKRGVDAQLDAIVDFSQTSAFLDTPIKFYSSGMKLRLGFAVAVHLDARVLLLDEVMATGDMAFQQKCHQKLGQEVAAGKTVVMVSHDLNALKQVCTKALYLKEGSLAAIGPASEVIEAYTLAGSSAWSEDLRNLPRVRGDETIRFSKIQVRDEVGLPPATGSGLRVELELDNPFPLASPRIDVRIASVFGQRLIWLSTSLHGEAPKGVQKLAFTIPQHPLNAGAYFVTLFMQNQGATTDHLLHAYRFDVLHGQVFSAGQVIPPEQSHLAIPFEVIY